MAKSIRVVLVGVGNCASALVQGLSYYGEDDSRSGLWHKSVGGYLVSEIEIVGAFDIDSRKVGKDISQAIFSPPNVVDHYVEVKEFGIKVEAGNLSDVVNPNLSKVIKAVERGNGRLIDSLREMKPDVVLNLISSGMDSSSSRYADAAIEAEASLINATPAPLASSEGYSTRFSNRGLVLAGDDLMSQFGGTVFHKGILNLMLSRGVRVKRSYQLDVGGGAETQNTLDEDLRSLKRRIKSDVISMELPYPVETATGTTDHVDFLRNSRTSYFWIDGEQFLGSPVRFDIYLRTVDGPNAGGLLLDLIRATHSSRERGEYGSITEICSYGFKRPPKSARLSESYEAFREKYVA